MVGGRGSFGHVAEIGKDGGEWPAKNKKTGYWSRGRDSGGFWGVLRFEKDGRGTATQNKMPKRKTEFVALRDAGGSKTLVSGCEVHGEAPIPTVAAPGFFGELVA